MPEQQPGAHVMKLTRLSEEEIAALSASILGDAGREPAVVELLQRETEGNAYFLVETVRTLSEEVGRLGDITRTSLPARVFAEGIATVVERRLSRVPEWAQPTLQIAAVSGRELDLALLRQLEPDTNLEDWLTVCSNLAVLEVQEGQWRFAHDKLRQKLLNDLSRTDEREFNKRVAEAIESLYPDDEDRVQVLYNHWAAAGNESKERHYAALVGRLELATSAYRSAIAHLQRSLELYEKLKETDKNRLAMAELKRRLGDAQSELAEYAIAETYYRASLDTCRELDDQAGIADSLVGISTVAGHMGSFQEAIEPAQEAVSIFRQISDQAGEARALVELAGKQFLSGDLDEARSNLQAALVLGVQHQLDLTTLRAVNQMAAVMFRLGDVGGAQDYLGRAIKLARTVGARATLADALNNMAIVYTATGEFDEAEAYFRECVELSREIGDRMGVAITLPNIATIQSLRGNHIIAAATNEEALSLARTTGSKHAVVNALIPLALETHYAGESDMALELLGEGRTVATEIGEQFWEGVANTYEAIVLRDAGRIDEARRLFNSVIAFWDDLGSLEGKLQAYLELGRLETASDNLESAAKHLYDGLQFAIQLGAIVEAYKGLVGVSTYLIKSKRYADAAPLLAFMMAKPPFAAADHEAAEDLFEQLEDELSTEQLSAAQAEGAALDLPDAIQRALRALDQN
ncbi:MAG: tetratricopeptide repeat protein [Chloroflexi bacterium]|nr:tetratricopeptide repeat protein [Chloroflexota bacterium]